MITCLSKAFYDAFLMIFFHYLFDVLLLTFLSQTFQILQFFMNSASTGDVVAVNSNDINTLLSNGVNTIFLNGKPNFFNHRRILPRKPPDCMFWIVEVLIVLYSPMNHLLKPYKDSRLVYQLMVDYVKF